MRDDARRLPPETTLRPNPDATRILHVVHHPDFQWITQRSQHALGPTYHATQALAANLKGFTLRLKHHPPALVTIHACAIPAKQIINAARACPHTHFLNVFHSSPNHMIHWPDFADDHATLLHHTRLLPNLHVGTPDLKTPWNELGYARAFQWPNPILLPQDPQPHTPKKPAIAIIARPDWAKAMPAQLTAARLLQIATGITVYLTLGTRQPDQPTILSHARAIGLKVKRQPWMELQTLWHWLHTNISVVLQTSFTETFNYLTIDAAACHVPFVASHAIAHCPPLWRIDDPNDPAEIAARTAQILANYATHKKLARPLAEAIAKRNNAMYAWHIARILHKPHANRPPADMRRLDFVAPKPT